MSETTTVAELLEVVRQLREQVASLTERVKELEAENKALREENTRLKKRIRDLERKNKKYTAPHSREERKLDPQRPGRKPGDTDFAPFPHIREREKMRVHTTKPVSAATRVRSDFIPLWGMGSQSV